MTKKNRTAIIIIFLEVTTNLDIMIKQFCTSILQLNLPNSKALANLVMGLASQTNAKSVVEISENPCYHYQYSSISKAIGDLYNEKAKKAGRSRQEIEEEILRLKKDYLPEPKENFWLLNTDSSPMFRPYSPTLPNRRFVYKPNNQIKNNKPVEVGYEFSCVGMPVRTGFYGVSEAAWNLPLSMELIPSNENKNSFSAQQVNNIMDNKDLPFHKELTVNVLDSNYSSPEYLAKTHHQQNLVSIVRLAGNRNVWGQLNAKDQSERRESNNDTRGANAVYGEKYKLGNVKNWARSHDDATEFGVKIGTKKYIVQVQVWEKMMIRSKRKLTMKDKSFRLVRIVLADENGNDVFKRELWLSVFGLRNQELSLEQIFWAYRHRFDIEHYFRYGKQKLLLDKFETPIEDNMSNWLTIVGLAYWLLWAGHIESEPKCPKWQQYDKNRKKRVENGLKVSPSEVQRQLEGIILGFEQTAFLPKPRKKGKGRKEGMKLVKKKRFIVLKKDKRTKKQVQT